MVMSLEENIQIAITQGKEFITLTRAKMDKLVEDFANGNLNREQFHFIYQRYQTQINGVKAILTESDPSSWTDILDGEKTQHIRKRLMARATGMLIYHHQDGALLETLGEFSIDPARVSPLRDQLAEHAQQEQAAVPEKSASQETTATHAYPHLTAEIPGSGWLFLARGDLATIVTAFTNEPTTDQQTTLMTLMRDFERANRVILQHPHVTIEQLAMPFEVFVLKARKR
jgi:hypothetical protein